MARVNLPTSGRGSSGSSSSGSSGSTSDDDDLSEAQQAAEEYDSDSSNELAEEGDGYGGSSSSGSSSSSSSTSTQSSNSSGGSSSSNQFVSGVDGGSSSSGSSSSSSSSSDSDDSGGSSSGGDDNQTITINPGDVSSEFVDRDYETGGGQRTDPDPGGNGNNRTQPTNNSNGGGTRTSGAIAPGPTGVGTYGSDGASTNDNTARRSQFEPETHDPVSDEDILRSIREGMADETPYAASQYTVTEFQETDDGQLVPVLALRGEQPGDVDGVPDEFRDQLREHAAADREFESDEFVITEVDPETGAMSLGFRADVQEERARAAAAAEFDDQFGSVDIGRGNIVFDGDQVGLDRDAQAAIAAAEFDDQFESVDIGRGNVLFDGDQVGLDRDAQAAIFQEQIASEDDSIEPGDVTVMFEDDEMVARVPAGTTPPPVASGWDDWERGDVGTTETERFSTEEMDSDVETELTAEQSFLNDISGGRFASLVQAGDDARAAITPGDDIPDRGVAADIATSGLLAPAAITAGALSNVFPNAAGEPSGGTSRTDQNLSTPSFDEARDAVADTRTYELASSAGGLAIRPEATITSELENLGAEDPSRPDGRRTQDVDTQEVTLQEARDAVADTRTYNLSREAAGSLITPEATIASGLENVGAGDVSRPDARRTQDVGTESVSSSEAFDAVTDTRTYDLSREAAGTLATPEATIVSDLENVGAAGISRPDARRTQNVETREVTFQEGRDAINRSAGSDLPQDVTRRLLTPEAIVADALQGFDDTGTRSEVRRSERKSTGRREMSDPILGAAAAAVVAPEPVSTVGGGLILGGAALATGVGAFSRRAEIEVPTEPQTEQQELEIDPQDVASSPSGEISVPEEGFTPTSELAFGDGTVNEVSVPDGTEQTDIREIQLSQLVEPIQRERQKEEFIPFQRGPEISEEEVLRDGDNTLIIETPGSEFDYTNYQPVRFPADEVRQVDFEVRSVEEPQFLESRGGSQTLTRQRPRTRTALAPDAGLRGEQILDLQSRLDAVVETGLDTRTEARSRMTTAIESVTETVQMQETVNVNESGLQYGFPNQPGQIDRPTGRGRSLRVPAFDSDTQYDPTSPDTSDFDIQITNPIATARDVLGVDESAGMVSAPMASEASVTPEQDWVGDASGFDWEAAESEWSPADSEWDASGFEFDAGLGGFEAGDDPWNPDNWEEDRSGRGGLFGGF